MKKLLLILWALLLPTIAFAQGTVTRLCTPTDSNNSNCIVVAPNWALPVTGSTNVATYSGGVAGAANSSAGDVYCVFGSATKTVKVKRISIGGLASAAVVNSGTVVKRSTANTGGTPTSVTLVPHDSTNAAATATATVYATAPSAGTLVGIVRSRLQAVATTSNANPHEDSLFDFSMYWDQPIVLRGVTQSVCLTIPSTAGGTWNIDHEHTEE